MNGFSNWLSRLSAKLGSLFRQFMDGRYGIDKLNMMLLTMGCVCSLLALLIPIKPVSTALMLISYALLIWSIFRSLSRNTYKRYRENRKYLMLLERFKDREHRYFDCPRCRQQVRVPRKKGKIAITCPKCREKFIKKT